MSAIGGRIFIPSPSSAFSTPGRVMGSTPSQISEEQMLMARDLNERIAKWEIKYAKLESRMNKYETIGFDKMSSSSSDTSSRPEEDRQNKQRGPGKTDNNMGESAQQDKDTGPRRSPSIQISSLLDTSDLSHIPSPPTPSSPVRKARKEDRTTKHKPSKISRSHKHEEESSSFNSRGSNQHQAQHQDSGRKPSEQLESKGSSTRSSARELLANNNTTESSMSTDDGRIKLETIPKLKLDREEHEATFRYNLEKDQLCDGTTTYTGCTGYTTYTNTASGSEESSASILVKQRVSSSGRDSCSSLSKNSHQGSVKHKWQAATTETNMGLSIPTDDGPGTGLELSLEPSVETDSISRQEHTTKQPAKHICSSTTSSPESSSPKEKNEHARGAQATSLNQSGTDTDKFLSLPTPVKSFAGRAVLAKQLQEDPSSTSSHNPTNTNELQPSSPSPKSSARAGGDSSSTSRYAPSASNGVPLFVQDEPESSSSDGDIFKILKPSGKDKDSVPQTARNLEAERPLPTAAATMTTTKEPERDKSETSNKELSGSDLLERVGDILGQSHSDDKGNLEQNTETTGVEKESSCTDATISVSYPKQPQRNQANPKRKISYADITSANSVQDSATINTTALNTQNCGLNCQGHSKSSPESSRLLEHKSVAPKCTTSAKASYGVKAICSITEEGDSQTSMELVKAGLDERCEVSLFNKDTAAAGNNKVGQNANFSLSGSSFNFEDVQRDTKEQPSGRASMNPDMSSGDTSCKGSKNNSSNPRSRKSSLKVSFVASQHLDESSPRSKEITISDLERHHTTSNCSTGSNVCVGESTSHQKSHSKSKVSRQESVEEPTSSFSIQQSNKVRQPDSQDQHSSGHVSQKNSSQHSGWSSYSSAVHTDKEKKDNSPIFGFERELCGEPTESISKDRGTSRSNENTEESSLSKSHKIPAKEDLTPFSSREASAKSSSSTQTPTTPTHATSAHSELTLTSTKESSPTGGNQTENTTQRTKTQDMIINVSLRSATSCSDEGGFVLSPMNFGTQELAVKGGNESSSVADCVAHMVEKFLSEDELTNHNFTLITDSEHKLDKCKHQSDEGGSPSDALEAIHAIDEEDPGLQDERDLEVVSVCATSRGGLETETAQTDGTPQNSTSRTKTFETKPTDGSGFNTNCNATTGLKSEEMDEGGLTDIMKDTFGDTASVSGSVGVASGSPEGESESSKSSVHHSKDIKAQRPKSGRQSQSSSGVAESKTKEDSASSIGDLDDLINSVSNSSRTGQISPSSPSASDKHTKPSSKSMSSSATVQPDVKEESQTTNSLSNLPNMEEHHSNSNLFSYELDTPSTSSLNNSKKASPHSTQVSQRGSREKTNNTESLQKPNSSLDNSSHKSRSSAHSSRAPKSSISTPETKNESEKQEEGVKSVEEIISKELEGIPIDGTNPFILDFEAEMYRVSSSLLTDRPKPGLTHNCGLRFGQPPDETGDEEDESESHQPSASKDGEDTDDNKTDQSATQSSHANGSDIIQKNSKAARATTKSPAVIQASEVVHRSSTSIILNNIDDLPSQQGESTATAQKELNNFLYFEDTTEESTHSLSATNYPTRNSGSFCKRLPSAHPTDTSEVEDELLGVYNKGFFSSSENHETPFNVISEKEEHDLSRLNTTKESQSPRLPCMNTAGSLLTHDTSVGVTQVVTGQSHSTDEHQPSQHLPHSRETSRHSKERSSEKSHNLSSTKGNTSRSANHKSHNIDSKNSLPGSALKSNESTSLSFSSKLVPSGSIDDILDAALKLPPSHDVSASNSNTNKSIHHSPNYKSHNTSIQNNSNSLLTHHSHVSHLSHDRDTSIKSPSININVSVGRDPPRLAEVSRQISFAASQISSLDTSHTHVDDEPSISVEITNGKEDIPDKGLTYEPTPSTTQSREHSSTQQKSSTRSHHSVTSHSGSSSLHSRHSHSTHNTSHRTDSSFNRQPSNSNSNEDKDTLSNTGGSHKVSREESINQGLSQIKEPSSFNSLETTAKKSDRHVTVSRHSTSVSTNVSEASVPQTVHFTLSSKSEHSSGSHPSKHSTTEKSTSQSASRVYVSGRPPPHSSVTTPSTTTTTTDDQSLSFNFNQPQPSPSSLHGDSQKSTDAHGSHRSHRSHRSHSLEHSMSPASSRGGSTSLSTHNSSRSKAHATPVPAVSQLKGSELDKSVSPPQTNKNKHRNDQFRIAVNNHDISAEQCRTEDISVDGDTGMSHALDPFGCSSISSISSSQTSYGHECNTAQADTFQKKHRGKYIGSPRGINIEKLHSSDGSSEAERDQFGSSSSFSSSSPFQFPCLSPPSTVTSSSLSSSMSQSEDFYLSPQMSHGKLTMSSLDSESAAISCMTGTDTTQGIARPKTKEMQAVAASTRDPSEQRRSRDLSRYSPIMDMDTDEESITRIISQIRENRKRADSKIFARKKHGKIQTDEGGYSPPQLPSGVEMSEKTDSQELEVGTSKLNSEASTIRTNTELPSMVTSAPRQLKVIDEGKRKRSRKKRGCC